MSARQFPAAAADSLIDGYCTELLSLASLLAEALAQTYTRGIDISASHARLQNAVEGMASLGAVIGELVQPQSSEHVQLDEVDETEARVAAAYSFLADSNLSRLPPDTPDEASQDSDGSQPDEVDLDIDAPVHFGERPTPGLSRALKSLTPRQAAGLETAHGTPSAPDADSGVEADSVSDPSLKGSNSTMPLHSVFQFVERVRKSGVMRVELSDEVMTFEFDGGWVYSCHSTNQSKGDRLGDLLADVADAGELQALLDKGETMNNLQIGELIVRSGLVSNGQVLSALETQVHRRFRRACEAVSAVYEFTEGPVVRGDGRIRITPMELTFQSRR